MFPVKEKAERTYLKNLAGTIEEYADENGIKNIDSLYDEFGSSIDTAREYFSAKGIPYVMRKMKLNKYIKVLVIAVICAVVASTVMYGVYLCETLKSHLRSEIAIVENEIEIIDRGEISDEKFEQYIQKDKSSNE